MLMAIIPTNVSHIKEYLAKNIELLLNDKKAIL